MKNTLEKISFYSFSKQDFVILLAVYNLAYFVSWTIIKGHLAICFVIAFLASLLTFLIIVGIDVFDVAEKEENKLQHEEEKLMRKIRDEYQKVYRLKRKQELLKKAGCLPEKLKEKNIVSDLEDVDITLYKDSNVVKEVRFNYIDKPGDSGKVGGEPEKQTRSQPEGS